MGTLKGMCARHVRFYGYGAGLPGPETCGDIAHDSSTNKIC